MVQIIQSFFYISFIIHSRSFHIISNHSETIIKRFPDLENHRNDVLHIKI